MKIHSEGKLGRSDERALVEAALRTVGDSTGSGSRSSPFGKHPIREPLISGYSIVREIHRGGQGVVYQAVRESTGRTVAIKVMREGPFAGLGDRARFDREVRVLAQLDHPNIVAVHDSGEAAGCYFFVMDHVQGEPLDAYVENEQPSVREIVELFAVIAEAVSAAHVRGVIHRDLKPSNVLIDVQRTPKVLDFGLAKVEGSEPAFSSGGALTVSGQFLGSLPWASPEQAEGKHESVDVRSDVYALGVMLFQMLTGKFPYEVRGTIRDVLDNIVTVEPKPPSTVRRGLDDEIGTIVLTALAKDPDRRYQTAGELARDLRRYLADEPIAAKRDSSIYVLRKTLRRHRVAISVAALILVVLGGAGVNIAAQYVKTREAQRKAVTSALSVFQKSFASINPDGMQNEVKVEELLSQAALNIELELAQEPEAQAEVRHMLGAAYKRIGHYAEARAQLERALEIRRKLYNEPHPKIADSLHELAAVHWWDGRYKLAEGMYKKALAMRRDLFGEEHVAVADTLNHLAACHERQGHWDDAERLYQQALNMRRELLGPQHAEIAATLNNFGSFKRSRARYEEAAKDFREAIDMLTRLRGDGPPHPRLPLIFTNFAGCLMDMGKHAEAGDMLAHALQAKRQADSPDQTSIASTLHSIAELDLLMNSPELAMEHCTEALELRRSLLRSDHPSTAASAHLAGKIKMAQGDASAAEPFFAEALRIRKAELRPGDPQVLETLDEYVACLALLGREGEAMKHDQEMLQRLRATGLGESAAAQQIMQRLADGAG